MNMNDLNEKKKDWKLFYFPIIILIIGYILFGKIEIMINDSSDTNPFGWSDYLQYYIFVFFMFLIFGLGFIYYYKFLTKNQNSNNNPKIIYVGILTLTISFIIYDICEEFLGVFASGSLNIPQLRSQILFHG